MIARAPAAEARTPPDPPVREEDVARVPSPIPGRSLVTRRAVVDVVRAAVLDSYGVTGFAGGPVARLLGRLGLRQPGLRVRLRDSLVVDLDLTVAYGLPIAEVARQVDSAVRYAVRRTLDREIGWLRIHVDGLGYRPAAAPAQPASAPATPPGSAVAALADDGTDAA